MKFKYNNQDDVLMINLSDKNADYAEQKGDLIVHFSKDREAVLLEILDASHFLSDITKKLPAKVKQEIFSKPSIVAHRIKS